MSRTIGGHRGPRRQAGTLAAMAAGLAVLVAACGGASPAGSPAPHPPGYQQYHTYSQCMRSSGAPFWPEPSEVAGQGVWDNPYTYKITPRILAAEHGRGWQAALTACQKLAPRALPYTAAQVSALRSRLRKLAACMRAHGITPFPSPAAGPYGAGFASPGPGVNPDSARFLAAQRACWVYAPGS
jgi:hypothetical protein